MGFGVTDSADIGSKGLSRINTCNLSGPLPSSEIPNQGKQAPGHHGDHQTATADYICSRTLNFKKIYGGTFMIYVYVLLFCRSS